MIMMIPYACNLWYRWGLLPSDDISIFNNTQCNSQCNENSGNNLASTNLIRISLLLKSLPFANIYYMRFICCYQYCNHQKSGQYMLYRLRHVDIGMRLFLELCPPSIRRKMQWDKFTSSVLPQQMIICFSNSEVDRVATGQAVDVETMAGSLLWAWTILILTFGFWTLSCS